MVFEVYGIVIDAASISSHFFEHGSENAPTLESLRDAWVTLLADAPVDRRKPRERVWSWYYGDLSSSRILKTIVRYSSLGDRLLRSGSLQDNGTNVSFIPEMRNTPVFREYLHWYRTGDPLVLRYLESFLTFGKKAKVRFPEFDETSLGAWREVEERLQTVDYTIPAVRLLKQIMALVLKRPENPPVHPHLGPGAVSEAGLNGVGRKSRRLYYSRSIQELFDNKKFGLASYARGEGISMHTHYGVHSRTTVNSRKFARVKFVAKNVTTSRTICCEPNMYMLAQQAVRHILEDAIKHSQACNFVNLQDQLASRQAAAEGSLFHEIDTIDLKAASDSVAWELVRRVFPDWALFLMATTRTSRVVLPDGSFTDVRKFAPMGSAVCFPTQCILFLCICLLGYAYRLEGEDADDKTLLETVRNLLLTWEGGGAQPNGGLKKPIIYGDDIACDTTCTQYIINLLTRLGFQVNVDKSFMGPALVRESCGGYYFEGEDITPLRFAIKGLSGKGITPSAWAGFISLANSARLYGYRTLRAYAIYMAKSLPGTCFRPCLPELGGISIPDQAKVDSQIRLQIGYPSNAIDSLNVDNSHLTQVSSADYQSSFWYRRGIAAVNRTYDGPGEDLTERYLLSTALSKLPTTVESESAASRKHLHEMRFVWGWTPIRV